MIAKRTKLKANEVHVRVREEQLTYRAVNGFAEWIPFQRKEKTAGLDCQSDVAPASTELGYTRRSAIAGLFSAGVLGLAGCDGFFISSTTTTTLTSSATTATYGASVVLTAKVVSASATGTVTFYDGTTELGTVTLVSGAGTYTAATLADGTHLLTAVYGGDTTFNSSTSAAVTVVVSAALIATATSLASSTTSIAAGMSLQLTATVSVTAATGTVQFYDASTQLGTGVVSGGVATYTTTTLAAGTHTLLAIYVGDSNYATSTSRSITITVT